MQTGLSLFSGQPLGDVMTDPRGRTTGFDYLRIALSTGVIVVHSVDVTYGLAKSAEHLYGPLRPFVVLILPMFFALSGFLVAGSLERCRTLLSFAGLRLIRLLPALIFETMLAAIVLGLLLSSLSANEYFSDPLFLHYFWNIVGHVQYQLPGMFADNPWGETVNAQLWTLPYELACYTVLLMLALFKIHKRRDLFVTIVVFVNIALAGIWFAGGGAGQTLVVSGDGLVLAFLYGICFYLYRDRVVHSAKLAGLAAALCFVLALHPAGDYVLLAPAAYLTTYLGLLRPKRVWLVRSGDYSYGMFLYGFPVQQAVVQVMGPAYWEWYWNLMISLPITIVLAMLSWHLVEKKALNLRGPLRQLEDRWMTMKQRAAPLAHRLGLQG